MRSFVFSIFIFAAFVLNFSWVSAKEQPSLVIGMELSYPPFEMIGPTGNPEGISVDLSNFLGEYLNRKVVITNIPFIGLIPALKTNKIDLIISSMTVTEERKNSIDFSSPYLTTGLCLLVSQKSDLKSIDDANRAGKTIVVKSGTSGEIFAARHLPLAKTIVLDKEANCVLEVVQGKADAFIYDQISVFINWQKHKSKTRALLSPFQKEYWAIGVRKGNQILLDQVNDFLVDFRQHGGFEKLSDKYFYQQKKDFKRLGVPFVF